MKKSILLIVAFFLMFSSASFGIADTEVGVFSNYINLPENSSDNSDTSSPTSNTAINDKPTEKEHKTDWLEKTEQPSETDSDPTLLGIPAQWRRCKSDSDCTAGVIDCVTWDALNKKYLHKLSENLNTCSASVDPGFQPVTACVAKVCKTTDKSTDVSWEDWLGAMRQEKEHPSQEK